VNQRVGGARGAILPSTDDTLMKGRKTRRSRRNVAGMLGLEGGADGGGQ